jgi:Uma2 family endonuclease
MTWQEICDDPSLQDLPYKIETNEYGQIVLSPASNQHSYYQGRILNLLNDHLEQGKVLPECSVETTKGVKVPDVVWFSDYFFNHHGFTTPYPAAPELCVEVVSPSNSDREIQEKTALYFASGAREVWTCDSFGNLDFYDEHGSIPSSTLFPSFPEKV